jgi:hypothetical protein
MAEPIDLNEFMNRFSEVMDYAFRRLVHTRPTQGSRPEGESADSSFAAPPLDSEGEIPAEVEIPPDLFESFATEEHRRLAEQAATDKREGSDVETAEVSLAAHQDYVETTRRNFSAVKDFMVQAAVDNHHDNQDLEDVAYSFMESRDTITDLHG